MSQTPITVTYSLEEILGQINRKLDKLQEDVTDIKIEVTEIKGELKRVETELKGDIKRVEIELKGEINRVETELKGEIKTLDAKVEGIGKRLDTQEFINRSVVVGFILAIGAGIVKLFVPNFPN
jgi:chromosome segregation ATPase